VTVKLTKGAGDIVITMLQPIRIEKIIVITLMKLVPILPFAMTMQMVTGIHQI
jgi:hypothetical protein